MPLSVWSEITSGAHNNAARSTSGEASIAVLPFANMSPESEIEFFADGITEEIINALTKIDDLRVAARTSAFTFKGKHIDLRIVGESAERENGSGGERP